MGCTFECKGCECSFEVAFTDHDLGDEPNVNYCPNCGCGHVEVI